VNNYYREPYLVALIGALCLDYPELLSFLQDELDAYEGDLIPEYFFQFLPLFLNKQYFKFGRTNYIVGALRFLISALNSSTENISTFLLTYFFEPLLRDRKLSSFISNDFFKQADFENILDTLFPIN